MSVWYAIPSKRPIDEARDLLKKWKDRGYKIAVIRDSVDPALGSDITDVEFRGSYQGYAKSVNFLSQWILMNEPDSQWIVTGGDDVEPDPNHTAEEIAAECEKYFPDPCGWGRKVTTFNVMQPTGDPWEDSMGRVIERIAGSPWMGREFCLRINGGKGPLWPEYTHCFVDEELQCVAQKLGIYWQRPDLVQIHNNWQRDARGMPEFLREANSEEHWRKYSTLFKSRKEAGFPGHDPL